MELLRIGENIHHVFDPEDFSRLLEEKLGTDAANYFKAVTAKATAKTRGCSGECDNTYRIQEHYERLIQDAVDELETVRVVKADFDRFHRILSELVQNL